MMNFDWKKYICLFWGSTIIEVEDETNHLESLYNVQTGTYDIGTIESGGVNYDTTGAESVRNAFARYFSLFGS